MKEETNKKKTTSTKKSTSKKNNKKNSNKTASKETPKVVEEVEEVKSSKNNKKKNTKVERKNVDPIVNNYEITNLIKIIIAITVIFLAFYGITNLITNNEKEEDTTTNSEGVVIQYDEIVLGELFDQPRKEYYVLFTTEDDIYNAAYNQYLSAYKAKTGALRVYTANLDNQFNSGCKSDETKTDVTDVRDLRLSDSTLLWIKDKKIIATYVGHEKILSYLNKLVK